MYGSVQIVRLCKEHSKSKSIGLESIRDPQPSILVVSTPQNGPKARFDPCIAARLVL